MYNIKTLQKGWLTAASVTALTLGGLPGPCLFAMT